MATTTVMKIVPPYTPELLLSVQKEIERFFTNKFPFVLELGSGWSTIWFSEMGDVLSYEHDFNWHSAVMDAMTNVDEVVLKQPDNFAPSVSLLTNNAFDLVLIDCVDEARLPCLFACLTKVKDDGWIVVDDTHWPMFRCLEEIMMEMGYKWKWFQGEHTRKNGEVKYHSTTIFCKKGFDNV